MFKYNNKKLSTFTAIRIYTELILKFFLTFKLKCNKKTSSFLTRFYILNSSK